MTIKLGPILIKEASRGAVATIRTKILRSATPAMSTQLEEEIDAIRKKNPGKLLDVQLEIKITPSK